VYDVVYYCARHVDSVLNKRTISFSRSRNKYEAEYENTRNPFDNSSTPRMMKKRRLGMEGDLTVFNMATLRGVK